MKRKIALAILSAAVWLAVPAAAQMPGGQGGPPNQPIDPEGDHIPPRTELPPDPEGKAEDLRLAGKCNEAIPILRRLAEGGDGFELAQYNLGLCLLDTGKADPDVPHGASLKLEGAAFVLKAASHNLPKAQASLAQMYLDGDGVARDPVEAGKWALIYRANGARFALGLPNISADLQARLDGALSAATWAQAQARADAWVPVAQASPE
ncbi:MAG: hypothetical protein WDM86_07965 [Rhizomicrobium sp.]